MASEERKAENRKLVAENLFKAQAAAPQQAETDAFQCGKCKQRRCMYYQMQTRSADEPMTVRRVGCPVLVSRSLRSTLRSPKSPFPALGCTLTGSYDPSQTFVTCLACGNRWKFS